MTMTLDEMMGVMRHIIVEGCDGTGKSTLISSIVNEYNLPVHPRASTSEGGPVDNLDQWVVDEFNRNRPAGIYDRHPLISETIYGPVVRGKVPGRFNDNLWLATAVNRLQSESFVVWCEPPWINVLANIHAAPQMAGVLTQAYRIYQIYMLRRKAWRGPCMTYDYTSQHSRISLHNNLVRLIEEQI